MSFTQGHALLIGVGSHQYHPEIDVPITVTDAGAVAAVLADANACGYPAAQINFLHEDHATKPDILGALDALTKCAENDTVFLFYCGHGALGDDGNYYLVSHDARLQGDRVVKGTGVSEGELLAKLRDVKAKRIFLVFNACFSGNISPALGGGEPVLAASSPSEDLAAALLATGSGRIIMTACREDQKSYIGSGTRTIFTQALVDGLRGKGVGNRNGYISAFNLYEYVFTTVNDTVSGLYHLKQEPELSVLKGVGPFAVALYRGASALGDFTPSQSLPQTPAVHEVTAERSQRIFNQHVEQSGGMNFGQGNQIDVAGNIVGGNNIGGDQIDAQGSQSFINRPSGPVEQVIGTSTKIDTGGGAYVGGAVQAREFIGRDKNVYGDEVGGDKFTGDKVTGDKVTGDKVAGDKVAGDKAEGDSIKVGNISGSTGVAIGRGAQSTVSTIGLTAPELNQLFAPLLAAVQQAAPPEKRAEAVQAVQALQEEVAKGNNADDGRMAKLIDGLAGLVPGAVGAVVSAFASPVLAGVAGPISKWMLDHIQGK